jgi:hypothetical protein
MVRRLKELCRMHMGHHGSPDLIDGHLPERVLDNVCCVLEPSGNTLMVLVLSENNVWWFLREGKVLTKSEIVSAESEIVSVKSGIVLVESGMVPMKSGSVSERQGINYKLTNIN